MSNSTTDSDGAADRASAGPADVTARDTARDEPSRIGRFTVLSRLGRGGIADVYRIADDTLGRELAVKVLAQRHADDPDFVARFVREAQVCSRLQHPGIVPIHELGSLPDGRPFFTMKVVHGETLDALLRARRDPSEQRQRFLAIHERVCQTIAFAHSRGIVHCDLKPANVMVGAFGEVQVLDWGAARSFGDPTGETGGDESLHAPAALVAGTPAYMAPEQTRAGDRPIDASADVFGLGAILCEILTGRPPYVGEDRFEILLRASQAALDDARERLRTSGGEPTLTALAERCLSPRPEDRPADAGVVAREVAEHVARIEHRAHAVELEAARVQAKSAADRRVARLTAGWALALSALIAIVALGYAGCAARDRIQRAQIETAIERATARAAAAHERAGSGAVLARWDEAVVAARQAEAFTGALTDDPPLLARVRRLVDEVERGREAADRDAQLAAWIDDLRPHLLLEHGLAAVDDAYFEAFARWEVDIDRDDPARIAARIRSSPLAAAIDGALLEWADIRRRRMGRWEPLLDLADLADDDPLRRRLRAAVRGSDRDELLAVASTLDFAVAGPATLGLLVSSLQLAGDLPAAIDVARRACLHWPEAANLSHRLAVYLQRLPSPPHQEIARALTACVAARPHSAHATTDLGLALARAGDHAAAQQVLARARSLDPDYARAWTVSGIAAFEREDFAAAERFHRQGAARTPGDAVSDRFGLVFALEAQGRSDDALVEIQRLVVDRPGDPNPLFQLGRHHQRRREQDSAIDAFRRSLAIDAEQPHALCNLGLALTYVGRYAEAVSALRRGHQLGMARAVWAHPSADWLATAERLLAATPRLEAIVTQAACAIDATERIDAARHAHRTRRYAAALALWRTTIANEPQALAAIERSDWYDAACSALRAAESDDDELSAAARRACRQDALRWLHEDLRARALAIDRGEPRDAILRVLELMLRDRDLASIRGDALAALPAREAGDFTALWCERADLAERARKLERSH